MDYFSFDLQLFADVAVSTDLTVDLTNTSFDDSAKTAQYFIKTGSNPAAYTWITSVNSLADYGLSVSDIIAMRTADGALTIAVKESGSVAQVKASAAALKGATVSVAKAFAAGTGGAVAVSNDATAVTASVQIYESTGSTKVAMVKNVKSATSASGSKADAISFDSTDGTKITVAAGNIVQAGFGADTKGATFTTAGVFSGGTDLTIVSGTVDVQAGGTVKVGSNSYTAKSDGDTAAVARLVVAEGDTMATLATQGTSQSPTASAVELGQNCAIKITGANSTASVVTNTHATQKIYVNTDGVISGLAAGDTFSVTDGATAGEDVTTYTVDGTNKLVVANGTYSGVYEATDAPDTNKALTVTTVPGGRDTITKTDTSGGESVVTTLSPTALPDDVVAVKLGNFWYKVSYKAAGVLQVEEETSLNDAIGGAGYFKAVADAETGVVSVGFYDDNGNASKLQSNVKLDFTNIQEAATDVPVSSVDVTGVVVEGKTGNVDNAITLTNLPSSIKGSVVSTGTKVAALSDASYKESHDLDTTACTIVIESGMDATTNKTKYYKIVEGSAGDYNVKKWSIATEETTTPVATESYFKVVAEAGDNGGLKYTVSFQKGTGESSDTGNPATLADGYWAGLKVKAVDVVGAGDLATEKVTVTPTTGGKDAYEVLATRGVEIAEATGVTRTWTETPAETITVEYKPLDNTPPFPANTLFVYSETTGDSDKVYWKVTTKNPDGNPVYTLTQAASVTAGTDNYFKVVTDATNRLITITYTVATDKAKQIPLASLTEKIKVDATGILKNGNAGPIDNKWTIDITDGATGEATNVNYVLSNVPAGTEVKGGASGKDTVNYTPTWENDITFKLASLDLTTSPAYYEVLVDGALNTATGYRKTKLGSKLTLAAEDTAKNYFIIEKTGNAYTITYHPATTATGGDDISKDSPNIKLGEATSGKLIVDADGLTKDATIAFATSGNVNAYAVTNAAAGIAVSSSPSVTVDVTYNETFELKDAKITLDGATNGTHYWTVKDAYSNGKHVYTFTDAGTSSAPADNESYFTVTYTSGDYTIDFTQGTATRYVTAAALAALSDKIVIDTAKTVAAGKKITFENAAKAGGLTYSVTNLNKGSLVSPENGGDELHYAKTFVMDATANKLTLDAEEGTKYYAVTTSGGDETKGELTVSIGAEIVIPADASEQKKADLLAEAGNYFEVVTEDAGNNNNVTIKYHKAAGTIRNIDLDGTDIVVNVDASGANDEAEITFGNGGTDVHQYKVTGLASTNKITETTGSGVGVASDLTYVQSYAISGSGEAATPIALDLTSSPAVYEVGDVAYFNVATRAGGQTTGSPNTSKGVYTYAISSVGKNATGLAAVGTHYFKVTYATETGVKIEYVNADGDVNYDFSKTVGKAITIDASKLGDAVTTIDITDTATNAGVDYALVNVPTTVTTIEGQTKGKDTVSYKETAVWAAGQVLTLADAAVQYFVVGGTKTAATVTAADEKPANKVNYFTVTRTSNATNPVTYTYTVTYTPAASGDAFDFSGTKSGTLEIAAGALPGTTVSTGTILALGNTDTSRYANVAITGAKGSLKVTGNKSDAAPYDTISYAQPASEDEFDGTPGIYYIKVADSKANFPASLQGSITSADKDTTFVEVTVAQDSTTKEYTVTVTANGLKPDEHTGVLKTTGSGHGATTLSLMAPDEENSKLTIAAGTTFTEITGVAKGSVLKNVAATTVVTSKTLTKGDTITIDDNGTIAPATEVFTSGGGAISVTGGKGTSGVFELAYGDATNKMTTLTGSETNPANGDYITATVTGNDGTGDGKVYVTFAYGVITGFTGMDEGETVTVVMKGGSNITYTYTYDATSGYVTREASDSSPDMYAAVTTDATTGTINVNVLDRGYNEALQQPVGGFSWVADTYYVPAGTTASGTSTIVYVASPTDKADKATNGTYYIEAKVTDDAGKKVLNLMPYKGNAKGLVDPAWDFKGTVTVNASDQPVQIDYTKERKALFNVAFTNVKAGSVFKCMKEYVSTEPDIPNVPGDTIETVALAEGESIEVQDYKGGTNVVYAAGTGGSVLKFADEALASGTIAAVNKAVIANGSTISNVTGAIDITVETKDGKTAISSIKNIGGTTEEVTITDADGTKTTFKAVSDTEITKTVETATGEKTVTTLKITAGADVWKATGTTKIFNNFGWTDGKSGYFQFDSGTATLPTSNTDEVKNLDAEHAGNAYVKADVAVDTNNVTTLTLSAYVVDATGALVPAASTDTTGMKVVVAPSSATKYNFSNKGNSFNVEIGNASADSVFTDMNTKDVVKTDTIAATTGKFTVNGNVWTAATASKFVVYVESDSVTRLVEGNVLVKGTLEAANLTGTVKETLTYSPSTATGGETDGVVVQYGKADDSDSTKYGVVTSITDLTAGESVTVVKTGSDNKKTTVTYEAINDVCFYSDGTDVKYIDLSAGNVAYDTQSATYAAFTAADTKAFDFATTTSAEAYFAVTDKEATVAGRTVGETYSYKDYGKAFVHATYTASGTVLTLKKVTVDKNGAFTSDGNFAGTETISVSAAGKTIVYADRATNNMKSLVVSNAGAGTTIAGWTANDILSTDTLAAPTYKADGTIDTSAKVTLGGHDYTASEKGSLTITGTTVASGKFLLQGSTTNSANTLTALSTGADNSTLEKEVTYNTTSGDGVNVTVSAGKVTKITGLGGGETVTVVTTAKDNLGNPVTVENPGTVIYEAAVIPAGKEKAGQIEVTKTAADGTQYKHVFADATQDILSDVAWTVSSQKTESLFDFADTAVGATGYFAASAAAGDTTGKKFTVADIKKQSTGDQPLVSGGKYLEVVASKDTTGKVTISSMRIVELVASGSKKGTFAEISGATVTTAVNMLASAYGSIDITAAANTIPLTIRAAANMIYTGIGSDDTLEFKRTNANDKVTVNNITYVTGDANKIVINGEGSIDGLTAKSTIQSGALQIKDAVITDEAGNTIVGKADGSTAIATFAKEKGITGLDTMAANETVTLTTADGTVTKWATAAATAVTRTVTANGVTETWKKTLENANDPVFGWESYVSNNKFDFGATAATQVGYFATTGTIAKTDNDNVTLTNTTTYVRIVAERGSDGVYTIKSLKEFEFKAANNGSFDAIDTTNITINSDGIGSMTLAADAIVLPKEDTSRDFTIAITNAKAGSTFTGFGAKDTVAGTLKNGETLTMVTTDEKGKEAKFVWTGGTSSTAAVIRGDGKAVNGTFTFAGGSATMEGGNAADTFTTKVTGAAAQIAFTDGNVTGIYNVGSGTVKIEKTTVPGGVVTTETYAITANGDNMNITKTVVADGVTTVYTGTTGKDLNAMDAAYTISGEPTLKSAFDWTTTSGTGTGYFLVSGVTTSAGKIATFETATIEKQTKFTAEKGAYYLKTVLSKDGVVSELSMVQLKEDGTLSDDLLTSTTKGAITIDGDGNAVTLNVTGANLTLVGVDVQNVAAKSNITMKVGDTLKTATLAADEQVTVTVNGTAPATKTFTSGASAALEVLGSGTTATPVVTVVNGSVKGDGATRNASTGAITNGTTRFVISGEKKDVTTDDVTVTVTAAGTGTTAADFATDRPVVTVVNGVVTNITGITKAGSSVRTVVAGASGLDLTYGLKSLTIAAGTFAGKTIKTVPLAAGTVITEGSTDKLTTAADGEVVMVYEGSDLTVKSGKFQFTATGSVTASGAKQDDANDNTVVAVTKATGNTEAVYVEIGSSTTGEGILRSVKGLEKGDIITVTTKQAKADGSGYDTVVTTYTATTATSITKAVTLNGTAQEGKGGTANITAGAEILSGVTYIGGDTPIDATENPLEGQLNWASIDGRATGYFELAEKTKTVSGEKISYKTTTVFEQPTKQAVKIPRAGKSNYYLQANIDNSNGNNELTFSAWQFDSTDGKTISKQTAIDLTDKTKVTANDMITITAPTTTSITFDKGTAQYGLTVNKLAAGSAFKGLDAGDKVTTNTLDNTKYEYVTMDSVYYFAGAKKALTFIGEGDAVPTEGSATNTIRLLSGTIRLDDYNTTAYLAGAKDATGGAADDIKIEVNDDTMLEDGITPNSDNVIVNVANGVITSITGLTHQNATVTVTAGTVKSVYKVVDANGTMIERQELKASDDTVQSTAYRTVVKGKEIYDAKANGDKGTKFTVADKYTSTAVDWATEKATTYVNLPTLTTAKTLAKGSTDADIKSGEFQATYGQYYLKVDMATKNNATTISGVTLQQADATGKLANVKVDKTTGEPAYKALLAIDGTISEGKFAKVTYKLPTTKTWTFKADNVALGSTFTNLGTSDVVQTANGSTFALGTDGKAFTVYVTETVGGVEKLSTQQVTYSGAGAAATYTTTNGLVVTGLDTNKETLTIVSDSATSGLVTTKYTYQADGTIKKEVTNAAGLYQVFISTTDDAKAATTDATIGGVKFQAADTSKTKIASDFDWTLDKNTTAYALLSSNNAATIKAGKNPAVKAGSRYIALTLDGSTAKKGVVATVDAVEYNAATGVALVESAISNATITVNAPTKFAMTFDRTTALANNTLDADSTKFNFSGAVSGSKFTTLAVGDIVKTASLDSTKGEYVAFDGDVKFTAGKKGQLAFTKTDEGFSLTSGTIKLAATGGASTEGATFAYAGTNRITADNLGITVTATTNNSGTTFTIGELTEGEVFRVEDASGNEWKYSRSGSTLFCEKTGSADAPMVMAFTKNSITSKELLSATATPKAWKSASAETLVDTEDGNKAINTANYKALKVDLATLDKRIATDTRATSATTVAGYTYDFVVDKYLAPLSRQAATLSAFVANETSGELLADLQTVVGQVQNVTGVWKSYNATTITTGSGDGKVAQTIQAAKDWDVTGSAGNDVIIGATSTSTQRGSVAISGGAGDDTITGGGATEVFTVGNGNDVLQKYTTGKDKVNLFAGFQVDLSGTAKVDNKNVTGVLLHDGKDADGNTTNSVLLAGMGNGKAVEVSTDAGVTYAKYYFGDGTKTRGNATFNFEEGAYYFANAAMNTTLKVATDKTKKSKNTLGENVTVDLTKTDYYHDIDVIDASGSGNSVYLVANNDADSKTTLKGGTYQSTLQGGAGSDSLVGGGGEDVFWFEGLAGTDAISNYMVAKDAIYLGNNAITLGSSDGVQIAASGKADVVLTQGDNKVTIANALGAKKGIRVSTDGTTKNTLSYYVGNTGAKNTFTATIGTDMIASADDSTVTGADGAKLKDYSAKSYYVGSTAEDAVKLTSKTAVNGVFDINSFTSNLSSIEVLDATGLSGKANAVSSIALIGSTTGKSTLRGSTNANVHEKFVVATDVDTIVENLTKASDAITFSGAVSSYSVDSKGTTFNFEDGGTLLVSKVKYDSLSVSTKAGTTTITRTK